MKQEWIYSSPSGGLGKNVDDKLILSGKPLSFGVFKFKTPVKGDWVCLDAFCKYKDIESPETSVTVMLSFFKENNDPIRRQYINPKPGDESNSLVFNRIFDVPENTSYCVIELALRWPGNGSVTFEKPVLVECEPPADTLTQS